MMCLFIALLALRLKLSAIRIFCPVFVFDRSLYLSSVFALSVDSKSYSRELFKMFP